MILCEFEDPVSVIHIGRNCMVQQLEQRWDATSLHYAVLPFISTGAVPTVPQCGDQGHSVQSDRGLETEKQPLVTFL